MSAIDLTQKILVLERKHLVLVGVNLNQHMVDLFV